MEAILKTREPVFLELPAPQRLFPALPGLSGPTLFAHFPRDFDGTFVGLGTRVREEDLCAFRCEGGKCSVVWCDSERRKRPGGPAQPTFTLCKSDE